MKYAEAGFRAFNQCFAAFQLNGELREALKDNPDLDQADCILTWGFADHTEGMLLEAMALGKKEEGHYRFFDLERSITFRAEDLQDMECRLFEDEDGSLYTHYEERINALGIHSPDSLERTRRMGFLDGMRDPFHIDDITVCLYKEGLEPETVWVRIERMADHALIGTLLEDPKVNFDCEKGDTLSFSLQPSKDRGFIAIADMNSAFSFTADDLADGRLLRNEVNLFKQESTRQRFNDIVSLLRKSRVWIVCRSVKQDEESAMSDPAVLKTDDGQIFQPRLLQRDSRFFFPVFSTMEDIRGDSSSFNIQERSFDEAVSLAMNNPEPVEGIVVNPFTDPFILEKEHF